MTQLAIPATLMRGGTSRGLYIRVKDLPSDEKARNDILLAAMGSPDVRQIDGVGGAHPLTSKVAILSGPTREDADIDYLFLQVSVDSKQVSDAQNCGNILAGVGPWAIEQGLVEASSPTTDVSIHMVNSGSVAIATVNTPDGLVDYSGEAAIDGVPGTAAPVALAFQDVAGSTCGALLPTGNPIDIVNGVELTCIDNGMPVVILKANSVGASGLESPAELESNQAIVKQIEELRLAVGERMNLGDVSGKSVPKMCLVAAPTSGGAISTRTFIPHRVHESIGVLGAVSVATACVLEGSVAYDLAQRNNTGQIDVEHPTGSFGITTEFDEHGTMSRVALLRTARKLFEGTVFIQRSTNQY